MEARVSEKTILHTGEAGDKRSGARMDMAMEMTTAATPTEVETAGRTISEPMDRHENRKRRRWSNALVTASDSGAACREQCDSKCRS